MRKAMLNVEKFNERARRWNMCVDIVTHIVETYEDKEIYIDEEDCFEGLEGNVMVYNFDGFGMREYELIWLD